MEEQLKFTEEEMSSLLKLRDDFSGVITQCGQLYIQQMMIKDRIAEIANVEKDIQVKYLELQKTESELLKNLTSKYGIGSVDITNGVFIPQKT